MRRLFDKACGKISLEHLEQVPWAKSTFVYVTHIRTTPEKLWSVYSDGRNTDAGEIVEAELPRRLVIRWQHQDKPELKAEGESHGTMELGSSGPAVKLSITHTIEREPSNSIAAVSVAWPMVISNLKSLLETGSIVLQKPYPVESAHSKNE